MTDFENAAFSVFVMLLSRAILKFNLNFYIPISKVTIKTTQILVIHILSAQVDENMQRAQLRNASSSSKFYFRKNTLPPAHRSLTSSTASSSGTNSPTSSSNSGYLRRKETDFFPLPPQANGVNRGPVEDEYEEMSMNEIMNGKA